MEIIHIADLHCHNYKTHNKGNYRLLQFLKLAGFIVEVAQENGVKEVWISGDLVFTPSPKPIVMYYLKKFFKILVDGGLIIRFTPGNHDLTQKSLTDNFSLNNLLHLLDNRVNCFYYDNEVIELCGKKIHFHSWTPGDKISTVEADILVSHGDYKDAWFSKFRKCESGIDTSTYKRALLGHLHKAQEVGNAIYSGSPLQHGHGDPLETSIGIYNIVTDEYRRVSTFGKFLQFRTVTSKAEKDELIAKYPDYDMLIRIKPVPSRIIESSEDYDNLDASSLEINPLKEIEPFLKKYSEKSQSVIKRVINSSTNSELMVPDLNFKFGVLKAQGFKSIKNIEFDFNDVKNLTIINGSNGAGKSTLFKLITFILKGKAKGSVKSSYATKNAKIKTTASLEVFYNGHKYLIERTISSLKLYKDGQIIDDNNKIDLQKQLEDELPFTKFMNIIYIPQSSQGIFSSMSETNRISFLSRFIGISLISEWTKLLQLEIDRINGLISNKTSAILGVEGKIEYIQSFINNNEVDYINLDEMNSKILELEKSILDNNTLKGILEKSSYEISGKISRINDDIRTKKSLEDEMNRYKGLLDSIVIENEDSLVKSNEEVNKSILEINNKTKEFRNNYDELMSRKTLQSEQLKTLKNIPEKCPTCHKEWSEKVDPNEIAKLEDELNHTNTLIGLINSSINENETLKDTLLNSINSNNSKINNILNNKKLRTQYETSYNSAKDRYDSIIIDSSESLESELNKIKANIDTINNKVNEISLEIRQVNNDLNEAKINNNTYEKVQESIKQLENLKLSKSEMEESIKDDSNLTKELDRFNSKVLSNKGLLVAQLLQNVADKMNSTSTLVVETVKKLTTGGVSPALNIKMYVDDLGSYIDYSDLSGGQVLVADLTFLSDLINLVGGLGLVMFDEIFKFFDDDNIMLAGEILQELNTNVSLLTLHSDLSTALADTMIQAELTSEGSKFSILGKD